MNFAKLILKHDKLLICCAAAIGLSGVAGIINNGQTHLSNFPRPKVVVPITNKKSLT